MKQDNLFDCALGLNAFDPDTDCANCIARNTCQTYTKPPEKPRITQIKQETPERIFICRIK